VRRASIWSSGEIRSRTGPMPLNQPPAFVSSDNGARKEPKETGTQTVLIKLSSKNKQNLLDNACQFALERRAEAEDILRRLGQLNAELAKQFDYKKIALSKLKLCVLCSTDAAIIENLDANVPSFLVISYCWRNPGWTPVPAARSTTSWGLSQPMIDKILGLRESKEEGIWIDQLCIDQENEVEKRIAIASMNVIYRAARRLIIILEDVELCDDEQKAGLRYASLYERMCQIVRERRPPESEKNKLIQEYFKLDARDLVTTKRFLLKMLSARWYSRAWCAHECKVSPHDKINNPLFLCFGSDSGVLCFEFRFIYFLAKSICFTEYDYGIPKDEEAFRALDDPTGSTSLFQRTTRIFQLLPERHSDVSLMTHLVTISSYGCEMPTDRISIALNAGRIPLFFRGIINSPSDGYWVFALLALASGDLGPLLLEANKLSIYNEETKSEVISWVDRPYHGPLDDRLPTSSPETITKATIEYIELDLFLLQGMPMRASEASKNKARSVIASSALRDRCHLSGVEDQNNISRLVKTVANAMKRAELDRDWLIEFLGSAIDCGIDWIRQFPDRIANEAKSGSWSHGQFNGFDTGFTDTALDLLSYLGITKEMSPNFDVEFLQPVIRFFTCITDHRLKFPVVMPRKICTSAAGDFAFTNATSDRSWVAVPVAVAHLPFFQNRAWLVEPFEPSAAGEQSANSQSNTTPESASGHPGDIVSKNQVAATDLFPVLMSDFADRRGPPNSGGTWRIRKKQTLVGCEPIAADGQAVVLWKKQKVYGSKNYDWSPLKGGLTTQ
jgi:Heterokaryon incompatibility protein (HET)